MTPRAAPALYFPGAPLPPSGAPVRRALSAALALALLAAPRAARAWCRTTSDMQQDATACVSTGVALFWGVRCIALSLNASALPAGMSSAQVRGLLGDALSTWGAVRCDGQRPAVDLSQGPLTTSVAGYFSGVANTNVVTFRQDWRAAGLPPSAIALTVVTFVQTTGEVRDADVMVNLTVPLSASADARGNDLPTALVHEVGHVLGLDHSNERTAVMWYGAGRGEQRRALQPDDVAGVCAIHPPSLQRPCAAAVTDDAGCGCRAGTSPARGWPLATLALIALRRRRSRAASAPRSARGARGC